LHGIQVSGQAQPTLEGNTCEGNKYSGITYFESAGGIARNNICRNNGANGIYVKKGPGRCWDQIFWKGIVVVT
jgi:parallel beta-helix repeat protein